ncbi:hypothetical protein FK529_05615 [Tsukamurella asaccharolytica]|uniref:Uncharacterized protein n=1 Tax=Tsukamurella asaccharolytica TaxID=2592067 RepID=A0A5C5RCZ7_9ACTN|nr:hypothetical protein [Tsukamurella asaccharolytica]TWS20800.1 hypothetical protein FK529_05615 [Tsukamurella asaccharolytica]
MPTHENLNVPVQIVIDEKKILEQIGWTEHYQDHDGEWTEEGGQFDLPANLAGLVADRLAHSMEREMRDVVVKAVTERAKTRVAEIIDEVIAGDIRKTNQWGEPVGEPTTLRALIVKEIGDQLNRKVNSRGETQTYARDGAMPYAQYVARVAAQSALKGELAEAAQEAVEQVKAKVTGLVAEELSTKIVQAVARA